MKSFMGIFSKNDATTTSDQKVEPKPEATPQPKTIHKNILKKINLIPTQVQSRINEYKKSLEEKASENAFAAFANLLKSEEAVKKADQRKQIAEISKPYYRAYNTVMKARERNTPLAEEAIWSIVEASLDPYINDTAEETKLFQDILGDQLDTLINFKDSLRILRLWNDKVKITKENFDIVCRFARKINDEAELNLLLTLEKRPEPLKATMYSTAAKAASAAKKACNEVAEYVNKALDDETDKKQKRRDEEPSFELR